MEVVLQEDQVIEEMTLRYDVSINLEEAYKGMQKNVKYTTYKSCSSCSGSGAAKGSKPVRCDYCSGRGK